MNQKQTTFFVQIVLNLLASITFRSTGTYFEDLVKGDSILLSGFPWTINGNPDNNLESHGNIEIKKLKYAHTIKTITDNENLNCRHQE
jgi:hypothetical protein